MGTKGWDSWDSWIRIGMGVFSKKDTLICVRESAQGGE